MDSWTSGTSDFALICDFKCKLYQDSGNNQNHKEHITIHVDHDEPKQLVTIAISPGLVKETALVSAKFPDIVQSSSVHGAVHLG
jgi:hypothetical protein